MVVRCAMNHEAVVTKRGILTRKCYCEKCGPFEQDCLFKEALDAVDYAAKKPFVKVATWASGLGTVVWAVDQGVKVLQEAREACGEDQGRLEPRKESDRLTRAGVRAAGG
jgi:hypothetical protein